MKAIDKDTVKKIIYWSLAALVLLVVLLYSPKSMDLSYEATIYHPIYEWEEDGEIFRGTTVEPGDEIEISWIIPKDREIKYPALCFNTEFCAVEAYVEGELCFDIGMEEIKEHKVVSRRPIYITLPEDCYGKMVTLHIYPSVKGSFSCSSMYYGNIKDLSDFYYQMRRFAIIIGTFLLIIGVLLTFTIPFLTTIYKQTKNILFHGPLLMLLGCYFLCYNQVFYMIVPFPLFNNYLEYICLYLLPFVLQGAILTDGESSKPYMPGFIFMLVDGCFIVVTFVLSALGVIFIKDVLMIGHFMILLQGIITFVRLFLTTKAYKKTIQDQYLYNGKIAFYIVMSGTAILSFLAFVEMAIWYVSNHVDYNLNIILRGRFLMVGALVLAAAMISSYFFYTIASINEKNIKKDLEGLAYNDDLTELANRAYCEQKMEMLTRSKQKCIVISLDMDGLKEVNDSIGHAAGDEMLTTFANLLKEIFGGSLLLGRMGGDEFIVILDGVDTVFCEKLLWDLETAMEDFNLEEHPFELVVSGGYACSTETEDNNIYRTYLLADAEMYKNKKRKKELEGEKV
ncbi:MAG: diguanylate cyclase [Lachnospiraceae bacterium]|nr:diguanylate cyclase [Lachnospiraceae bacterium]